MVKLSQDVDDAEIAGTDDRICFLHERETIPLYTLTAFGERK